MHFPAVVTLSLALAATTFAACPNAGKQLAQSGTNHRMEKQYNGHRRHSWVSKHRKHKHHSEGKPKPSSSGSSDSKAKEEIKKKKVPEPSSAEEVPLQPSPAPSVAPEADPVSPPQPSSSPASSAPSSGGAGATNGLDLHNSFRAKYGAPAMEWDDSIAAGAQSYAESCAMGHSGASGLGENLSWGPKDMNGGIQLWLDEAKDYDWNNPGYQSGTGHFTQVVWKGSTKLGCGFSACGGQYGTMIVCRYSPPGNYVNAGEFEKNVGRPVS